MPNYLSNWALSQLGIGELHRLSVSLCHLFDICLQLLGLFNGIHVSEYLHVALSLRLLCIEQYDLLNLQRRMRQLYFSIGLYNMPLSLLPISADMHH